ncbi:hypothetical protein H5410_008718 [Solanum commersonii]|uniref:Uncharacterized protein n=1 Tax=Solanum commersonii TaxID=4109 RepID=A0A9J6AGR9_SOLCO|nr:hypothetical protein H5410_008718 [Solanum commersonii]
MQNALRSATRAQPLSVFSNPSNFHIFSKSSSQIRLRTLLIKSGKQDDTKMEPRPRLWRQCPAMERDMQLGQMKKVLEGSMEETKRMRKRLTMEIPLGAGFFAQNNVDQPNGSDDPPLVVKSLDSSSQRSLSQMAILAQMARVQINLNSWRLLDGFPIIIRTVESNIHRNLLLYEDFWPVVITPNLINQVSVSVKRAWTKSMRTLSDPLFRLRHALASDDVSCPGLCMLSSPNLSAIFLIPPFQER